MDLVQNMEGNPCRRPPAFLLFIMHTVMLLGWSLSLLLRTVFHTMNFECACYVLGCMCTYHIRVQVCMHIGRVRITCSFMIFRHV